MFLNFINDYQTHSNIHQKRSYKNLHSLIFLLTLFVDLRHQFYKCEYLLCVRKKRITTQYPQKNYMIDIFHFIRILNPILMKNYQEIFVFSQKIDIYSDLV